MKLKLIYDAVNGHPIADGKMDEVVTQLIKSGGEFVFSNSLFFDVFRLHLKQGEISPENVEVLYFNKNSNQWYSIIIHKDGRCDNWPQGFCDKGDDTLSALLDWTDSY